jgi:hypothetical protein
VGVSSRVGEPVTWATAAGVALGAASVAGKGSGVLVGARPARSQPASGRGDRANLC